MIYVYYYGIVRNEINQTEEMWEVHSVGELVKGIGKKYGASTKKMVEASHIMINGKNAGLIKGYGTKLEPEDKVKIIPVTAGG